MPESPDANVRQRISAPASRLANPQSPKSSGEYEDKLSKIICDVVQRRASGEIIRSEDVIARHPEVMPYLRDELNALDLIHQTIVARPAESVAGLPIDPIKDSSDDHPNDSDQSQTRINLFNGLRIHGYCLESEINAGGQATVFKAIQERTGRVVAMKIMHGGPHVGFRGRKRFERESAILARLNHPNIVSILDKGRTLDGSFFLVMDFIDGRNLDRFVQESEKDTVLIIQTFVKIAKAVDGAHQSGVIHRDLKPMNIVVDNQGEPHILDFGMARLLHDSEDIGEQRHAALTRTGQMLGSLPWSSPEQLFSSPDRIDARSDIYAIGVMLYTALAGEFPYSFAGELRTILQQMATATPAPLVRVARRNGIAVSSFLEEIVLKALCKTPDGRYRSAGVMARDLESVLAGKTKSTKRRLSFVSRAILVLATLTALCVHSFDSSPTVTSQLSFINDENMRFVRIPAGSIPIGDLPIPPNEADWLSRPYVRSDRSFYMSATPVTQREYLRVMGQNPSDHNLIGLDAPVQCVTWIQAVEFCAELSKRERRHYRLPTLSEWQYAFYSGESRPVTQKNLESETSYANGNGRHFRPVAQELPDQLGLYDMIGEVRQWCSDLPIHASNSVSHASGTNELSYIAVGADYLTPESDWLVPIKLETHYPADVSLPTVGFRVVCESVERNNQ